MTWDEFKKYIDKKLVELGKDANIEIAYMDFSYPEEDIVHVQIDRLGDLVVTN